MPAFDPAAYGPSFAPLIDVDRNRPLDAGRPLVSNRQQLEQLAVDAAFAHAHLADGSMARCCLSAVWLLHDFLDESHRVSQEIETTSGSFWHGIMHRREGDFGNSKYWFRRVGSHEVLATLGPLAEQVGDELSQQPLAERIAPGGAFDPYAFIDVCQTSLRSHGQAAVFCRRIQQAEWEMLFDHCYRYAVR